MWSILPKTWCVTLLLLILGMKVIPLVLILQMTLVHHPQRIAPILQCGAQQMLTSSKTLYTFHTLFFWLFKLVNHPFFFFNWSSSCPRANILFSVVVFFVKLESFFSFSLEIKFLLAPTVFFNCILATFIRGCLTSVILHCSIIRCQRYWSWFTSVRIFITRYLFPGLNAIIHSFNSWISRP